MNGPEIMKALYPADGGPAQAFMCLVCIERGLVPKTTRTLRGMWMHMKRVHNLKKQTQFEFPAGTVGRAVEEVQKEDRPELSPNQTATESVPF